MGWFSLSHWFLSLAIPVNSDRKPQRELITLAALGTEEKARKSHQPSLDSGNSGFSSLLWFTNKSSQGLKIQFTLLGPVPEGYQPLPTLNELCQCKAEASRITQIGLPIEHPTPDFRGQDAESESLPNL